MVKTKTKSKCKTSNVTEQTEDRKITKNRKKKFFTKVVTKIRKRII